MFAFSRRIDDVYRKGSVKSIEIVFENICREKCWCFSRIGGDGDEGGGSDCI